MERGSTPYRQRIRSWWSTLHQNRPEISFKKTNAPHESNMIWQVCAAQHTAVSKTSYTYCRNHGYIHKLINMLIPSVYAQDVAVAVEDPSEPEMTMMEKVNARKPKIVVMDQEVQDYLSKETGRDRLRAMFGKIENQRSDELLLVMNGAYSAGVFSFLIWSVIGGKQGKEEFLRKNQHKKYLTKFKAARAYSDAIFVSSLKTGFKWGFKVYVFSALFLLTSQTISVYRNKSSVLDFVAAGALTCSLLRLNLGLKGFVAGGIIGTGLGLIGGTMMYSAMWLCSQTQEDKHYWHVQELLKKQQELSLLAGKDPKQPLNIVS